MAALRNLEWSDGAAGPVLRLVDSDPHGVTWQDRALCAQADPEVWFPDPGNAVVIARRICRRCPVQAQCLEYALDHNERFGVWGGTSEAERREIKRKRLASREAA